MKIAVVYVTYNPDRASFRSSVESLLNQVDHYYVVDNGSKDRIDVSFSPHVTLLELEKNHGIAFAQNAGILCAKKTCYDYILLSDQDTVYPKDYVFEMMRLIEKYGTDETAAFTPVFFDAVKNETSRIMLTKTKAVKPEKGRIYSIAHAISSATIIPIGMFEKVGLMNEKLFIDFVDNEWCWRAVKKGFEVLSFPDVEINHTLGYGAKKILGVSMTTRSVFRYYYTFRNGFYLLTTKLLSFPEKIHFLMFLLQRFIAVNVLEQLSMKERMKILQGIRRGTLNRMRGFES